MKCGIIYNVKTRLDILLTQRKIVDSRSQAESYIKLGKVFVDGIKRTKPGFFTDIDSEIKLLQEVQYVSRAGLKLESVAKIMKINFKDKVVLDVGSSTGGFTDYSLRNGATKWIPVTLKLKACHSSGLFFGGFCLDDDDLRAVDEGLAGSRSAQCFWGRTALRRRPENP